MHPHGIIWMWTLTTEQEGKYATPEEAHQDITQNERIRKLAKKMGWKHWSWVLEWHKSGWPHWHLIYYAPTRAYIDKHEVQKKWGGQNVHYKRSDQLKGGIKDKIKSAAGYITKYLTKPSESPVPDWLLDSKTRVRMCSSSRAWSAIEQQQHQEQEQETRASHASAPETRRTHREAIESCGDQAVLIRESVHADTGEIYHEYLGTVNLPYRSIRRWIERRFDHAKAQILKRHAKIQDKTQEAVILRQFLDRHMI